MSDEKYPDTINGVAKSFEDRGWAYIAGRVVLHIIASPITVPMAITKKVFGGQKGIKWNEIDDDFGDD